MTTRTSKLVLALLLGVTSTLGISLDFMNHLNCTGNYYEDTQAVFVQCFNENGVLIRKHEAFYTKPLGKDCMTTTFGDLQANLTEANVNVTLSADMEIRACDYYKIEEGYQFSQLDSIGVVYFSSKVGGDLDLEYKNMTA